jgi:hypothetical protein
METGPSGLLRGDADAGGHHWVMGCNLDDFAAGETGDVAGAAWRVGGSEGMGRRVMGEKKPELFFAVNHLRQSLYDVERVQFLRATFGYFRGNALQTGKEIGYAFAAGGGKCLSTERTTHFLLTPNNLSNNAICILKTIHAAALNRFRVRPSLTRRRRRLSLC